MVADVTTPTIPNNDFQPNGLTRSRRSHFSHADTATDEPTEESNDCHISYEYDRLIHFSKSPHSWELPRDWLKICELYPNIVRNKVCGDGIDPTNNNHNHNDYVHANKNITHKAAAIQSNNHSANNHSFRHRGVATSQ